MLLYSTNGFFLVREIVNDKKTHTKTIAHILTVLNCIILTTINVQYMSYTNIFKRATLEKILHKLVKVDDVLRRHEFPKDNGKSRKQLVGVLILLAITFTLMVTTGTNHAKMCQKYVGAKGCILLGIENFERINSVFMSLEIGYMVYICKKIFLRLYNALRDKNSKWVESTLNKRDLQKRFESDIKELVYIYDQLSDATHLINEVFGTTLLLLLVHTVGSLFHSIDMVLMSYRTVGLQIREHNSLLRLTHITRCVIIGVRTFKILP